MTIKHAVTIAILLMPVASQAGNLQIQFKESEVNLRNHMLIAKIVVKNTTNRDFARVGWACMFHDKEGFKIGGGEHILYYSPSNSVAVEERVPFYFNGIAFPPSIKCELLGVEELTTDNERLYPRGPHRRNSRLTEIGWGVGHFGWDERWGLAGSSKEIEE